jgi:hypothetical protein
MLFVTFPQTNKKSAFQDAFYLFFYPFPASGLLLFLRINADLSFVLALALKFHYTRNQCKKCVVTSDTHIVSGMEMRAALTNKYIPGTHKLTVCTLSAQTLAFTVPSVSGTAHAFLVRKQL